MKQPILGQQLLARLDEPWIDRDAGHRAELHALRLVEVADTLGALVRVDLVDLLAHRDGLVGALGFADVAVDALVGDQQGHGGGVAVAPVIRAGTRAP